MFGYLILTHPIGTDGQFIKTACPTFQMLIKRLSMGECNGFYGLLCSQATNASRDSWEYRGRGELPYHADSISQTDLIPAWADDDLGMITGAFACASVSDEPSSCGVYQDKPRTVGMVLGNDASEMVGLIDQYTIDTLPTQTPLQSRILPVLEQLDTGAGVCIALAPSTLVLHPGNSSIKLSLFVVWIAGSLFLIWHSNPMLVTDVISSLNGDRTLIPHMSNTIGYSQLSLRGLLPLNYNLYLKHTIRDMSRAGQHSLRLSTIIARTIYRISTKGYHQ